MMTGGTARRLGMLATLVFAASACGSDADSDAQEEASASKTSIAAEVDPSPAPPEQIASIIAGERRGWREVIDHASDCRFDWLNNERGSLAEANRTICYMREVTAGYSALNAIKSLSELTPPDSMTQLIDETTAALASVGRVELDLRCGRPAEGPIESKECDTALNAREGAYLSLQTVLDKWDPYL